MNSFGVEKGTAIRMPSTANLMIDSQDALVGANSNPGTLTFVKPNAFMNGYFTRLSLTEACLNYNIPNVIGADLSGFQFTCDVSGGSSNILLRIPSGFYNVAELIDAVAASMDAQGSFGNVTVIENWMTPQGQRSGQVAIEAANAFRFSLVQPTGNYAGITINSLIRVNAGGPYLTQQRIGLNPNLGITQIRYLDFVSNELTYAQDVKDANTLPQVYDVLLRWYMNRTDDQGITDKYGYPVPYGATPIKERRIFSPPKVIRWDNNLPLGNFTIDIRYNTNAITGGTGSLSTLINAITPLLPGTTSSRLVEYLFTCQVSEV